MGVHTLEHTVKHVTLLSCTVLCSCYMPISWVSGGLKAAGAAAEASRPTQVGSRLSCRQGEPALVHRPHVEALKSRWSRYLKFKFTYFLVDMCAA
jgi:hypothetical protein